MWARRFGSDQREATAGIAVDRSGQIRVSAIAGLHRRPDGLLFRFDDRGRATGEWAVASPDADEPAAVVAGPDGVAWVGTLGGDVASAPSFEGGHRYVPADGFVQRLTLDAPGPRAAPGPVAEARGTGPAAVDPLTGR